MKKHHILYLAITALTLGGCGSAGNSLANAITDPLTPREGGYRQLSNIGSDEITSIGLLPGASKIQITDDQFINTPNHVKDYSANDSIPIGHKWQNAFTALPYVLKNAANREIESGVLEIYKQSYSAVVGAQLHRTNQPNSNPGDFHVRSAQGEFTRTLPTQGIINYQGRAMAGSDNHEGRLNYQIDYGTRKGHGSITGLAGFGNIDLQEGDLTPNQNQNTGHELIAGDAVSSTLGEGRYQLGIFGPQANEIAGKAHFRHQLNKEVGFAGGRVN